MTESPRGWGVTSLTGIPTIAFGSQKGGTGKTTATINSAAALTSRDHDVLAIDMDPQADMTKRLGLDPGDDNDSSSPKNDLPSRYPRRQPTHGTTLSEIVIHSDDYEHLNFDLVPSHKDMGLARDWMDDASARLSLKTAFEALVDDSYDYDFILIDCPPDLSVLTDAAFITVQNVFLTAQTQATSRDALDDLWNQPESIEDNQQIEIAIVGLLANMYIDDGQSQKFLETFDESYASLAPIFKLPMRVAIQRAWDNDCDIFEWEDANDQQVERDLFLEVAETMERAFDKAQVEV